MLNFTAFRFFFGQFLTYVFVHSIEFGLRNVFVQSTRPDWHHQLFYFSLYSFFSLSQTYSLISVTYVIWISSQQKKKEKRKQMEQKTGRLETWKQKNWDNLSGRSKEVVVRCFLSLKGQRFRWSVEETRRWETAGGDNAVILMETQGSRKEGNPLRFMNGVMVQMETFSGTVEDGRSWMIHRPEEKGQTKGAKSLFLWLEFNT